MPAALVSLPVEKRKKNKFRRGAVVQLRSGGPAMTVEKPGPELSHCVWFDDIGNEVCNGTFLNDLLCKYVEPPQKKQD